MLSTAPPSSATEPPGVAVDGTAVRQKRKLSGLTMAGLAQLADISAPYISHIELGRRKTISPPVFARICDALGVEDRRELMRSVA